MLWSITAAVCFCNNTSCMNILIALWLAAPSYNAEKSSYPVNFQLVRVTSLFWVAAHILYDCIHDLECGRCRLYLNNNSLILLFSQYGFKWFSGWCKTKMLITYFLLHNQYVAVLWRKTVPADGHFLLFRTQNVVFWHNISFFLYKFSRKFLKHGLSSGWHFPDLWWKVILRCINVAVFCTGQFGGQVAPYQNAWRYLIYWMPDCLVHCFPKFHFVSRWWQPVHCISKSAYNIIRCVQL